MLLVKNTEHTADAFGDKESCRMIKDAGFDALDYSMFRMTSDECPLCGNDYKAYVRELKDYTDSLGISFVQGHAPFPSYRATDPAYSATIKERILRSIEISGMLGISHLVVHPIAPSVLAGEDCKEFNMAFYRSLLPQAKEYNVKICLENMWGRDTKRNYIVPNVCSFASEFADFLDTLDSEYFVACLDLGHCGLIGEDADQAIRILGHDRLQALHVHDNNHLADQHILPFYGKMDWNAILTALREINYQGNFTYEADCFLTPLPHDKELFSAAMTYMEAVGRYLIRKIG